MPNEVYKYGQCKWEGSAYNTGFARPIYKVLARPLTILASASPRPSTKGLLLSAPSIAHAHEACAANGLNMLNWNLDIFNGAIFHLTIAGSKNLPHPTTCILSDSGPSAFAHLESDPLS